jgi:hypothetical protein
MPQRRARDLEIEKHELIRCVRGQRIGRRHALLRGALAERHYRVLLVRIEQHDLAGGVALGAARAIDNTELAAVHHDNDKVHRRIVALIVVQTERPATLHGEMIEAEQFERQAQLRGQIDAQRVDQR